MKNFYNKTYKISVIVPVYRVEKYIKRCLDSITNQTYTNLEIILIDDGSDDGCGAICDSYAQKDSRIRVIHQTNKGLSSARNVGLKEATGDFIAFVDSDDYINVHIYERMMKALVDNDADIAMCDYKLVYDEKALDEANADIKTNEEQIVSSIDAQYLMCKDLNARITYTVAWNKLYLRKIFDGITYPEGRIHEDEARTHELLYNARSIVYVKSPLYYYFQRNDGIVGSKLSVKSLNLIDAYIDRLCFYRKKAEYALWKMEAIHAMRTYCRLQKDLEDAGIITDFEDQAQFKRLTTELGKYNSVEKLPLRLTAEIKLFSVFYGLYFGLYRKKHSIGWL